MNLSVRTSVLKKPSISADAVDQRHRRLVAIARAEPRADLPAHRVGEVLVERDVGADLAGASLDRRWLLRAVTPGIVCTTGVDHPA